MFVVALMRRAYHCLAKTISDISVGISFLLLPFVWAIPLLAQTTIVPEAATPPVNTRLILQQAIAASGGLQSLLELTHISGTGTITYHWAGKDTSGTASLDWSSTTGLTFESDTEYGRRTLTATAFSGSIIDEREKKQSFETHNAARIQLQYLPTIELALILHNPASVTQSGSPVVITGQLADAIMVSHYWPSAGSDAAHQAVIFYLSRTTGLVLRRDDYVEVSPENPGRMLRQISYSDYRKVDGIYLPSTVSEVLNQQPLYTLTLTQLSAQ